MKKNPLALLIAFALLFGFTSCEKPDESIHNVYFYTSNLPTNTTTQAEKSGTVNNLSLYVNGQYHGDLPYLNSRPNCDTDSLNKKTVFLSLKSGSYQVEARDIQGNVKSASKLKITDNGLSTTGGTGGTEINADQQSNNSSCLNNDCLVVNLFY